MVQYLRITTKVAPATFVEEKARQLNHGIYHQPQPSALAHASCAHGPPRPKCASGSSGRLGGAKELIRLRCTVAVFAVPYRSVVTSQ